MSLGRGQVFVLDLCFVVTHPDGCCCLCPIYLEIFFPKGQDVRFLS